MDVVYTNDSYFIHDETDKRIYIKSRGIGKPKVFVDGLGGSPLFGRSLKSMYGGRMLVFNESKKMRLFEINKKSKLGRQGEIKISDFGFARLVHNSIDKNTYTTGIGILSF